MWPVDGWPGGGSTGLLPRNTQLSLSESKPWENILVVVGNGIRK